MTAFKISPPLAGLKAKIKLCGDKSISHRAIILSAVAIGKTTIDNLSLSEDCLRTIKAFRKLGVKITLGQRVSVYGKGILGFKKLARQIYAGDSGTTMRLLCGILAGQDFDTVLTAGKSLMHRPMRRVVEPLRLMGAGIRARGEHPPIIIKGLPLKAITYKMPVASAQVKSAILLAGLYAKGMTRVIEPVKTRDHTERMLRIFKAKIKTKAKIISIQQGMLSSPGKIFIPADISSASFFIVAAALVPRSEIVIKSVSLNPTRTGVIKVLKRMGANIKIQIPCLAGRQANSKFQNSEPMGDLLVKSSKLIGTIIKKEEVPSLIDELPILTVAACNAKGRSVFEGVEELRVKESDRISAMLDNLKKMGADIKAVKIGKSEKIIINGSGRLTGCKVKSYGDHRVAMSMAVAGLAASGETKIDDMSCIKKSFPDFTKILNRMVGAGFSRP